MDRLHLIVLVVLVLALNLAVSSARGQPIDPSSLTFSAVVASLLGVIIFIFDNWLWRLPFLHPWFVVAPNINGTWNICGSIVNPVTGKRSKEHTGKLTIRQTFFSIRFRIEWDGYGKSKSLTAEKLAVGRGGLCSFSSLYEFESSKNISDGKTHRAGIFFFSDERIPGEIRVHYSTVDQLLGVVKLVEHQKILSWRNLWIR
jgi:SMODS-associating 2TM, beta-strand rich effector domain